MPSRKNCWTNEIKMPSEKRAKILWMLFSLEVWYKKIYLHMKNDRHH